MSARNRILLIEDEENLAVSLSEYFELHGYNVQVANSRQRGEACFRASRPDVVISDYRLPDGDGSDLLESLQRIDDAVPVVFLTAYATIDLAVHLIKQGASHLLTKPVELSILKVLVERVLDERRRAARETALATSSRRGDIDPFAGKSDQIARVREMAMMVAEADAPVLIGGETGSGKGVLARWLHAHGPRSGDAFVDINCAGLSRDLLESELFGHEKGAFTGALAAKAGLFEIAHRGSAFLDEIGDIDMEVQPKLLKVLEEKRFRRLGEVQDRTVDVRLIAATHRDLNDQVRRGRFRMDLLFRINTLVITLPSLRERAADIPLLAEGILARLGAQLGRKNLVLTNGALESLKRYPWPGNLREMRNVLERAVLLTRSSEIGSADLRFDMPSEPSYAAPDESLLSLAEVERRHILRCLDMERGSVDRAAKRLGVPRSTLYRRIKEWDEVAAPIAAAAHG